MTIDPKLFEKYTGRRPGDAMNRLGESLAKQSARGPSGDTSFRGSYLRGRLYTRVGIGLLVLFGVLYFLIGDKIF